jgi:signal transduction histidine kinase
MTRRLFFALAALAVVVLLLTDALGRDQVVVAERRGAVIDLEREAFKVALAAQDDLEHPVEPDEAVAVLQSTRRSATRFGGIALVTDRNGTVIAAAPARARPAAVELARQEATDALRRSTTASRTVRLGGTDYEVAEVPIVANQGVVGVVLLAQRSAVLDEAARDRLAFLTPPLLIAIGLSIVLALVLARALTRPLGQLVIATRRVARERGTAPSVDPRGPAEVRELAEAFNAMSLRVRELVDRESQFASDVSHQLRTPLTTLGVAVERTRMRGSEGDIPGAGESLAAVQAEVTRLSQLVEGLLLLTRIPLADALREPVDVAAVARDRAVMWRELTREHGVTLTVRAPAGADALAVPGAVDQILDNLLDNAVEVAPRGSEIAIEVVGVASVISIAVTDQGPGMSDEARSRAFDRFWRADGSSGDGIGIGLTIVRDLTEACAGAIELLPAEGGGTRALLTLEAVPGRVTDPAQVTSGVASSAMTARLRARLRRYLRARTPERAAAVEAEVWLECTRDDAAFDGCDECATAVFSMAHDRIPVAPDGGAGGDELDAHLLRTLGGLDTAQIATVLELTPRTVERLERRARRTLMPVVDGRLVSRPEARSRVPRAARIGGIAAVAVVVATGTAAATGSLPDPVQREVARVLRGVGVHVPEPAADLGSGLTDRSSGPGAASNTATPVEVRHDGALVGDPPVDDARSASPATTPTTKSAPGGKGAGTGTGTTKVPPGTTKTSPAPVVPPGQTKQSGGTFVPPGQAKQSGAFVPPGHAKQASDMAAKVPPGQAKRAEESTAKIPPGQAKKTGA